MCTLQTKAGATTCGRCSRSPCPARRCTPAARVRMLDALEGACAAWPEGALRVEHFESTLATLDPSKEQAFEVELKDSGLVLTVPPDQTLLSALRAANVDVQSDCEEGLCGSCEVRVLSGKVDHRDVVLTRMERDGNTRMMACCSRACKEQGQGQGRLVLEL
jgi:ferredoxin